MEHFTCVEISISSHLILLQAKKRVSEPEGLVNKCDNKHLKEPTVHLLNRKSVCVRRIEFLRH